jgi:glycosyltransferase involved in cell wall biosynthesis
MAAIKRCKNGSLPASIAGSMINYFNHTLDFFKLVDVFICPSTFLRNKFIEFNFNPEKLRLIRLFANLPKIRNQGPGEYGIYLGRLEREKGVYQLLKAIEGTDIPFKFIGDGRAKQDLVRMAARKKLKHIEFTGFKSGYELNSLISGALFAVVPALIYEIGPLTIPEVFSFAKPVIGFRMGGIPEIIQHGKTGFILDDFEPETLRQKMIDLYSHPEKAVAMGQQARHYVESAHNPEQHCQEVLDIYYKLTANRPETISRQTHTS